MRPLFSSWKEYAQDAITHIVAALADEDINALDHLNDAKLRLQGAIDTRQEQK